MSDSKKRLARIARLHKQYQRAEQKLTLVLCDVLQAEHRLFESLVAQLSPEEQRGWWKRLVNGLRKIDPTLPGLDDAVAAIESTPHGVTKRRRPRKRSE